MHKFKYIPFGRSAVELSTRANTTYMFQGRKIVSYVHTGSMAIAVYILSSDEGIERLESIE